jgi:hypothetical protein
MNPLQVLLSLGLSAGGAAIGSKERPTLDPEMLKRLFGPNATAEEVQALFNLLKNSPAFSQILSSNAMQGTQIGNAAAARMGAAGTSETPIGSFLGQAGRGYGQTLNRGAQAQLFMEALKSATQNIQSRQDAYVGSRRARQETPTFGRMVGASMLTAGANGFSNWLNAPRAAAVLPTPQEMPQDFIGPLRPNQYRGYNG